MPMPSDGQGMEPIEVVPVVVLSQIFLVRPSSIPDIRDFIRYCLAESPLAEEDTREVGETVFRALLDAAGPTRSINIAFRIFPEHVEVDVLHSDTQITAAMVVPAAGRSGAGPDPGPGAGSGSGSSTDPGSADSATINPVLLGRPGQPATFAEWMSTALRREGMTQEAAAWQLGVSVKTIRRRVGGATEPRMRDLRRIQEVFGLVPLP
ncbi:MAG: helix-turn-helix domain-containing protein [Streptosporangiaceae bacterium]